MSEMTQSGMVLGLAALALVESLLLELRDRGVLSEAQLSGILDDVAETHSRAAIESGTEVARVHRKVGQLVSSFRDGAGSVHLIRRLLQSAEHPD